MLFNASSFIASIFSVREKTDSRVSYPSKKEDINPDDDEPYDKDSDS